MSSVQRVILTGFMGAGKTTVGRLLAEKLGWPFIDLDARIEAETGRSITELFQDAGEVAFRRSEKELLSQALQEVPLVLATGGGAILDPESRQWIKQGGVLVALTAPARTIYERLRGDRTRPLLQVADPLAEIQRLIELRQPFYEEADYVIDSSRQGCDATANAIARFLERAAGR